MPQPEEEALLNKFDKASKDLRRGLGAAKGGQKDESNYSSTYQALVKLGLRPQLRKKYRWK